MPYCHALSQDKLYMNLKDTVETNPSLIVFGETWPSFFTLIYKDDKDSAWQTFRDSKSKNQLANGALNRDSKREKLFTKVDSNLAGTFLLLCVSSWNLESDKKSKKDTLVSKTWYIFCQVGIVCSKGWLLIVIKIELD